MCRNRPGGLRTAFPTNANPRVSETPVCAGPEPIPFSGSSVRT
uniref:Uncharacterized protein n=1 Tax=Anopheles albimanus TaxID=7167 RepID=A0A182FY30_ANOAL